MSEISGLAVTAVADRHEPLDSEQWLRTFMLKVRTIALGRRNGLTQLGRLSK